MRSLELPSTLMLFEELPKLDLYRMLLVISVHVLERFKNIDHVVHRLREDHDLGLPVGLHAYLLLDQLGGHPLYHFCHRVLYLIESRRTPFVPHFR